MAGSEGTSRGRRCQSWWKPSELAFKIPQVCRATEGRHEGGLDSAGEQSLPVGGLGTRTEEPEMAETADLVFTSGLPPHQALETTGHSP